MKKPNWSAIVAFFKKPVMMVIVFLIVSCGAWCVWKKVSLNQTLKQISQFNRKGFFALSVDVAGPVRWELAKSSRGCQLMMETYELARSVSGLQWTGQACLNAGIESVDVYLGLSIAQELSGDDFGALRLLSMVVKKFDKLPNIHYKMARIFQKNKRDSEALISYKQAHLRAPDNQQILFHALKFVEESKKWKSGLFFADRLKVANVQNVEIVLLGARIFKKLKDSASLRSLLVQVKELIIKNPGLKAQLQKSYKDLIKDVDKLK